MNKDMVNKNIDQNLSDAQLDRLFTKARCIEAEYCDDNFTKMVINQLPAKPHSVIRQQYLPEILGLVFGLIVTFLLIEPSQILQRMVALFPSNLIISPSNMLLVSVGLGLLTYLAWWYVERNPRMWNF